LVESILGTQVFKILPDGNTEEIKTEGPIKDVLKSEECYIIVSDEYRKVYLWKGVNSNVRSKFIGAKMSQDIRGQVGMHYGVVPLDEGEEDPDFLKLIGRRTGGGITPHPYIFTPPKPPPVDINYIIEKLEEKEVPSGFERDLVIIGHEIYIVQENLAFGIKKKQHSIQLIEAVIKSDGFLFVKNYRARMLIKKNLVLAIELLRHTNAKKLKFSPKDGGEDYTNTSKTPLKDLLSSDECYIIVSYEHRKVYLWKGKNSNVRSKFIGAKKSQDLRMKLGIDFVVVPLNEGEEDSDFLKLIGKITKKKRDDDDVHFPYPYIFKPPGPPDDDDVYFPYPYIFKPPEPPDDFAMAPQLLIHAPLKEKELEEEVNCQFCGMELAKEEQFTHSCKEKPNKT